MQPGREPEHHHPVEAVDLTVLIGWLALYEALLAAGSAPDYLTARLRQLFIKNGLLLPRTSEADLARSINQLNHRLRRALGENPPAP